MSEEMKLLLKLTEENAKLKTIIKILKNRVEVAAEKDKAYIDVIEFLNTLNECVEDRELKVIHFDNCPEVAHES
jgi:hypothetical protein